MRGNASCYAFTGGGYENAVQRLKRRKFITLLGADDGAKCWNL
jgi:hypothetical protein